MPLFMDVRSSLPEGATVDDVAQAHTADLKIQDRYGVRCINYWTDPTRRRGLLSRGCTGRGRGRGEHRVSRAARPCRQ